MQSYLEETDFLDFNHTNFINFLKNHDDKQNSVEQAMSLYEYVRDYFLYDPYHLDLRKNALTASKIVLKKRAWCVEKSIVLCASFRKYNIPARLGFAVVTNHIGVEKLTSYLNHNPRSPRPLAAAGIVARISNSIASTSPYPSPGTFHGRASSSVSR